MLDKSTSTTIKDSPPTFAVELQSLLSAEDQEQTRALLLDSLRLRDVAGVALCAVQQQAPLQEALRFCWHEDLSGQLGEASPIDVAPQMLERTPRRLFDWVIKRDQSFWLGRFSRFIPFSSALLLHASAPPGKPPLRDLVAIPYRHRGHCHLMMLGFHARPSSTVVSELNTLALAYVAKWIAQLVTEQQLSHVAHGETLELTQRQLECLQWVVAGKSLQEVATITEMSYANVRYHLERAKQQAGYSSLQQLMVHAALHYGLSPLGPDDR